MKNESYFIKGFPDYRLVRLSDRDFCVLSKKKGYWEEIGIDRKNDGHIQLALYGSGFRRSTRLHVLVAEMFVPNPEGKPIVHHIDFDASNNDPANLIWVSPSEHQLFHFKDKHRSEETRKKISETLKGKPNLALSKSVEQWSKDGTILIARYESIAEASRQTDILHSNIVRNCQGKLKSAGGYKWRYAD